MLAPESWTATTINNVEECPEVLDFFENWVSQLFMTILVESDNVLYALINLTRIKKI